MGTLTIDDTTDLSKPFPWQPIGASTSPIPPISDAPELTSAAEQGRDSLLGGRGFFSARAHNLSSRENPVSPCFIDADLAKDGGRA